MPKSCDKLSISSRASELASDTVPL